MLIEVIPFKGEHLKEFDMRILDAVSYNANPHDEGVLKSFEFEGNNITLIIDGKIVGMGGVMLQWKHVAVGWILASPEILKYKFTFYKTIYRHFLHLIDTCSLHRIEANVLVEYDRSMAMLEHMGFKIEGLMRKYDAEGNDYFLYSWVKD